MNNKAKTKRTLEDIPNMMEDILDIQQKEIDRLQTVTQLTGEDVKNSVSMLSKLSDIYYQYRQLKQELRKEAKAEYFISMKDLCPRPTKKSSDKSS